MQTAILRAVATLVAVVPGMALGLAVHQARVEILTVCEVLGNWRRYANTNVAVVGRMERSVSIVDHYDFLAQDNCEHPVITNGHTWKSKIVVRSGWEEGMPKPPPERAELKPADVAPKLSLVRKTTELGFHDEPRITTKAATKISIVRVPNEWAVMYGRITVLPDLNENCGIKGCGGFDAPLIVIVEPFNIRRITGDGTLIRPSERPK